MTEIPDNYSEQTLYDLDIEDVLQWPHTPNLKRYEKTVLNSKLISHLPYDQARQHVAAQDLIDVYYYNALLREQEAAIEASRKITGALSFVNNRDLSEIIRMATEHMSNHTTIALAITMPTPEPSITDDINAMETAYMPTPGVTNASVEFIFATLPRHPAWMGLSPALTMLKDCNALVFEDNHNPGQPATVVAYPKPDFQEDEPDLTHPFPPGQARTLRNLLLWHQATPLWIPSDNPSPTDPEQQTNTPPYRRPARTTPAQPPTNGTPHQSVFCSPVPPLSDMYEASQIQDMMEWPNTPGFIHYAWATQEFDEMIARHDFDDVLVNPLESNIPLEEFCDARHYQTFIYNCDRINQAEEKLRDLLTSPGHLNLCQLALNAVNVVDTSVTTGLCIFIPAANTHANPFIPEETDTGSPPVTITEDLIRDPVDISITEFSKDPDWAGLDPSLPSLQGLNALVVEDSHNPDQPAAVIALPPSAIPDPGPLSSPFPKGQAETLRDLLAWHGATPFWVHPGRLADLQNTAGTR